MNRNVGVLAGIAAAALLLGGLVLLRPRPVAAPLPPRQEVPPQASAPPPPRRETVPQSTESDGSSPRSDSLGIPRDPREIAAQVRKMALEEYPALLEKLKGALTDDERETLELRKADLPGKVEEWSTELVERKQFGYEDLYSEIFRTSPYFKETAAEYLAATGTEAATTLLVQGISGSDVYSRAAAAGALLPYLLEKNDLPPATRDAYRKLLSDDLSAVTRDPALYGANETRAEDLAQEMRGASVRVLTQFKDPGATALLLDLVTGKDGVDWSGGTMDVHLALYRHLAQYGTANDPPLMAERLVTMIDAHMRAAEQGGGGLPGSPEAAALVLAALGRPQKQEELKTYYYGRFKTEADPVSPYCPAAGSLLALQDARPVDFLLGKLTSDDPITRNQAVTMLSIASGQKIGTDLQLHGTGTPEERVRWSQVQQQWRDWWTAHRSEFESTNPYAGK